MNRYRLKRARLLFPAHAGVILHMKNELLEWYAVPRTRGGDPETI